MRIIVFIVFLLLQIFPAISYSNDSIKTDKIDAIKSQQTLSEYQTTWAEFKKEDPKTQYRYITMKFDSNYILHIFFSPALAGTLDIFVLNDKSEIILEQRIGMSKEEPDFDYKIRDKAVLISYQTRIERCVGPGLSESIYERQIELFDGKQVTIFRIMGNVESHNYGEKNAAYSDYFDQKNEVALNNAEIVLSYEYKLWKNTGESRDDSFLSKVRPDEQANVKTYVQVVKNDLVYDPQKSNKITSSQASIIEFHYDDFKKSGYKKDVVRYQ